MKLFELHAGKKKKKTDQNFIKSLTTPSIQWAPGKEESRE